MEQKRSSDAVACNVCGKQISRTNLSHHRRSQHSDLMTANADVQARSRSSSRDTHVSDVSSRCNAGNVSVVGDAASSCAGPASAWCRCSDAAYAVVSQGDRLSEDQLSKFVASYYPEIPAEHRHILIRGAVAGAMYAARLHFSIERNRVSSSAERRVMAIDAGCTLASLNQGLWPDPVGGKEQVSPAVVTTVEADTLLTGEESSTGLEIINLADLHMPVSLEACRQEFNLVTQAIMEAGITPSDAMTEAPTTGIPCYQASTHETTVPAYDPLPTTTSATAVEYVPTPIEQLREQNEGREKVVSKEVANKTATAATIRSSPRKATTVARVEQRSFGPPQQSAAASRRPPSSQRPADCRRSPRRHEPPRRRWSPVSPRRRVVLSREEMKEFNEFKAYKRGSRH